MIVLYILYVVSMLIVAISAYTAPIGYEDETGFHVGEKSVDINLDMD